MSYQAVIILCALAPLLLLAGGWLVVAIRRPHDSAQIRSRYARSSIGLLSVHALWWGVMAIHPDLYGDPTDDATAWLSTYVPNAWPSTFLPLLLMVIGLSLATAVWQAAFVASGSHLDPPMAGGFDEGADQSDGDPADAGR